MEQMIISAAARMSALQSDVTGKKYLSVFPRKRMNSHRYFVRHKMFLLYFGGKTFCKECTRIFRYFVRFFYVADIRWAKA